MEYLKISMDMLSALCTRCLKLMWVFSSQILFWKKKRMMMSDDFKGSITKNRMGEIIFWLGQNKLQIQFFGKLHYDICM